MATRTVTVDVDVHVDLDDFDTDDLIDELESRGYTGLKNGKPEEDPIMERLQDAAECLMRGDFDEALIHLSRNLGPDFRSLPDLARRSR